MDNNELIWLISTGTRKAFEPIDHEILLKLVNCLHGIRGLKLNIKSAKVIVCGVPQGSILGPLLFVPHVWNPTKFI